jgi:anthranilate synthase component II
MILIFDNYDSFTYNLYHLVEKHTDTPVHVRRNDEISLEEVNAYDRIILSPGPGLPSEANNLIPLIKGIAGYKPILGVCLGHQAIAEAFGGKLKNLASVHHGVSIETTHFNNDVLFTGIPQIFKTGRYHSWVVDENTLPEDFIVTAKSAEGTVMAMKHQRLNIRGVQFHPESVLTEYGDQMIVNWLIEK